MATVSPRLDLRCMNHGIPCGGRRRKEERSGLCIGEIFRDAGDYASFLEQYVFGQHAIDIAAQRSSAALCRKPADPASFA